MSAIHFRLPPSTLDEAHDNPESIAWAQEHNSVRDILANYVQPDSTLSLEETISQVVRFWNESRSRYFPAVLMASVRLAEQIPYDHPAHNKLAGFIMALYKSEKWMAKCEPTEHENKQILFWAQFDECLRDSDWSPLKDVGTDNDPIEYANRCAFAASIRYPEWESERFPYIEARAAMTWAAESDHTLTTQIRDARLIGAAQFINSQAQTIYDEVRKSRRREAEHAQTKGGWFARLTHPGKPLKYSPEHEFYWRDWQTWKNMFRAAAVDETRSEKCRDIAQTAADLMALQEKTEDDRSAG